MDQSDESVLIFDCGQEQALQSLRSVKNPTLSMGFVVDLELIIDNKALRLVAIEVKRIQIIRPNTDK